MMFVILQESRILRIFILHPLTRVRIIALMTAGSTNEIERTIVRAIGSALISGHVLIIAAGYFFAVGDSRENRLDTIRINRANNLIGMVVSLQSNVDLTRFHHWQHAMTEYRRLLIRGVV